MPTASSPTPLSAVSNKNFHRQVWPNYQTAWAQNNLSPPAEEQDPLRTVPKQNLAGILDANILNTSVFRLLRTFIEILSNLDNLSVEIVRLDNHASAALIIAIVHVVDFLLRLTPKVT